MRGKTLTLVSMLLVAGCSQQASREAGEADSPPAANFDVREPPAAAERASDASAGPDISPTAAPGVAFNYAYRFRLPARQIATVQEQHAQACEKLGIARCRITGMRYQLRGEDQIAATLALKLAPEIARAFGKEGILAVENAKGIVVDTQISGLDVGTGIAASVRDEADLKRRIADLEAQRARSGLKEDARAELTSQIEALRAQLRARKGGRVEAEDALASTPMEFTYGSGDGLIPGFDPAEPIRNALQNSGRIIVGTVAFLIQAVAILLPFVLLIAAFFGVRRVVCSRYPSLSARKTAHPEGSPQVVDSSSGRSASDQ